MVDQDKWTTEEFGTSHEGRVGVLLADGSVPAPVYFDTGSGSAGRSVTRWSIYDGSSPRIPQAAALRAVCSCGWTGPEHRLDRVSIAGEGLEEAGDEQADACERDWDGHTARVEACAIPLPESVTVLLERLEEEIDRLTRTSPAAAVRAARRLEVTAERVGYWAARGTRAGLTTAQAAAALGVDEQAAILLMARFGRWSPYS
ncbi:hypothetical protein AMK16_27070 [Streptomyces sp. CB00455]|uniref:hypothetical protein n=1 Tax=Streptomyces sp. CB00455 TaxID=1703927 RepID=UPI00093E0BF6|nr:hypothetical protein [Streptomyces sp. CB00455]OKK16368.1 hypothetical protein AMK16_27070 [Streptomyces sp. CB00455]